MPSKSPTPTKKGVGATLKLDLTDSITELKELTNTLNVAAKSLKTIKDYKVAIKVPTESKTALDTIKKTAKDTGLEIDKLYDKIARSSSRGTTKFGAISDIEKLKASMAEARRVAAQGFGNILSNGLTGLVNNNQLQYLIQTNEEIAKMGVNLRNLRPEQLRMVAERSKSIKEMGENLQALKFGQLIQDLHAIEQTNAFVKMADDAKMARQNVIQLGESVSKVGGFLQKAGNLISKAGQGVQNYSRSMLRTFMALQWTTRGVIESAVGGTSSLVQDSIDQIKNLEQATIGFENFFTKKERGFDSEIFLERIRQEARIAQGVNAGDLAGYISQVAPVAANSDQAFNATLGILKAISYGGGSASQEMPNVVKNIRDVLAKGQAYAMDINQFNRAIPVLTSLLGEMGLDQYLKNGQLSITKENVGSMMSAFAKLNDPTSPVYDILEKMSNTLGGAQEMTKETIVQAISASVQSSGLLDMWKGVLKNEELQTTIQKGIDKVISSVASFLKEVGIEHLITEAINMLGSLGSYFGQTITPALKNLFGLDEGASMQEVVDSVIKLIGDFGKGLIDGLRFLIEAGKWVKDTILPVIKKVGEVLGIDSDSLAQWAGFFVTAAPLLSPLLKIIGGVTREGGKLLVLLGKWLVKSGRLDIGGDVFSNGKLVNLLGGSKLSGVGGLFSKLSTSGVLRGLGIIGTGHALSGVVGALFGGADTALGKVTKEGTALASTFMGLLKIGNPLIAGIGTAIEALANLANAQNEYAKQLKKDQQEAMEKSFDKLQTFYKESAIESLRAKGLYHEGDEASQQAYAAMIEFINNNKYDSTARPEQVMQDFINAYMQKYSQWKAGDNMLEMVDEWLDPQSDKFITGYTKINKENAQQYADKIRAVYQKMFELGFVGEYDSKGLENVQAYDLWKYLYNSSQNFGSVEFLNKFYENINNPDWIAQNIASQDVPIKFKVEGTDELSDSFDKAVEAAGFHKVMLEDGRVAWQDDESFKIFVDVEINKEKYEAYKQQMQDLLDPSKTDLFDNKNLLDPNGTSKLPAAVADPGTLSEKYNSLKEEAEGVVGWLDLIQQILFPKVLKKSSGGYIRPIYRANGGFEQGVDTVPAMLAPGEFVHRSSAVSLAGLGVMQALNRGDLSGAYSLLGAKLTHNVNTNNYGAVSNTDSHNQTTNYINNFFRNASGAIGGLNRLGRKMAYR